MILVYTFFIPYIFKIYNGFSFYIYIYTFFIPYISKIYNGFSLYIVGSVYRSVSRIHGCPHENGFC